MTQDSKKLIDIDLSAIETYAQEFPSSMPKNKQRKSSEPKVSLTLEIPSSLAKKLKIKAAKEQKTQRAIILEGLRLLGFEIDDLDLIDKRKNKQN